MGSPFGWQAKTQAAPAQNLTQRGQWARRIHCPKSFNGRSFNAKPRQKTQLASLLSLKVSTVEVSTPSRAKKTRLGESKEVLSPKRPVGGDLCHLAQAKLKRQQPDLCQMA